jgi:hypothetical protein
MVTACGSDLGTCNEAAARELVYSRAGLVATKGQALVHDSCGAGAFCHSSAATGKARFGAPGTMDFDMLPRPEGWPDVVSMRDPLWDAVQDDSMPPRGVGAHTLSNGDWAFDRDRKDPRRLTNLNTHEGKAAFRNWLACGAPVVAETGIPSWAQPPVSGDGGAIADFHQIFTEILTPKCATAGCHNSPAAGGLVLVDECAAYEALLAQGSCGGEARVVPGDASSYLMDKLTKAMPQCGAPMPPAGKLPEAELTAIRNWVESGADAPACK